MTNRDGLIYIVRWDNHSRDTYRYGTDLAFREDGCVLLRNANMPSGTVIRSWSSHKNYQADRIEPQLPILRDGQRYEIRVFLHSTPENTVPLRLRFYNRQQASLGETVLENESGDDRAWFTAPAGTDYWTLEMIAGGLTELLFHHMEICQEEEGESDSVAEDHRGTVSASSAPKTDIPENHAQAGEHSAGGKRFSPQGNPSGEQVQKEPGELNLLLLRMQSRTVHVPPRDIQRRIPGLRMLTAAEAEWRLANGQMLTDLPAHPVRINFIGYDRTTDELAARARVAMYGTGLAPLCHVIEADQCVTQPAEVNPAAAVFADRSWILAQLPQILGSSL